MKGLSDKILVQLNNIFKTYKIFFVFKASDILTWHFDVFFFLDTLWIYLHRTSLSKIEEVLQFQNYLV